MFFHLLIINYYIKNSSSSYSNKPSSIVFDSYVKVLKSIIGKDSSFFHFSRISWEVGVFFLIPIKLHFGIKPNKVLDTSLPASWWIKSGSSIQKLNIAKTYIFCWCAVVQITINFSVVCMHNFMLCCVLTLNNKVVLGKVIGNQKYLFNPTPAKSWDISLDIEDIWNKMTKIF